MTSLTSLPADVLATYGRKRTSMREALRRIHRGKAIFIGSGCAEPLALTRGLIEHAHLFADNSIVQILTRGEAAYTRPEYANNFRLNTFFIGSNVREAVQAGRGDYTPILLSDIPSLFASHELPLEVALIQVTPPDEHGLCSLGVSVDIVKAAAHSARLVIAQVNTRMPRTAGDSCIHLDDINAIIEADEPLPEWSATAPGEIAARIGQHVARLVPDGATLQLGIGSIPDALLVALQDKKDLGIHTEMLSDGIMRLVQQGVINGRRKSLHPNVIVTSFCMGTQALYDWVDENPDILFFESDYTNDPAVIRRNDNMVAINSAIQVDLTGQVCADSIGTQFYSGVGGQVDFMRGAAKAKGGRPVIALPSTAQVRSSGRVVSRIVPALEAGAGVVTSRADVHYVVTEYGIAYLHGKSISERVRALIEIAHPDFRNELLAAAKARHYVHSDLGRIPRRDPYPQPYEHTQTFHSSTQGKVAIHFRPIRASDERRLQDFFYSHSNDTICNRYGYMATSMSHRRALNLVQLDYEQRLALIGVVGTPGAEQIVAVGRYEMDEDTGFVEVAFVVHEDYRGLGIATHLLEFLAGVTRHKNFEGITAQVLSDNTAMLHIFHKVLGQADEEQSQAGETFLRYNFKAGGAHPSIKPRSNGIATVAAVS